ncbi:MAG TPA: hypothetical protein VGA73_16380 [Candidatus Binatia bacterium]
MRKRIAGSGKPSRPKAKAAGKKKLPADLRGLFSRLNNPKQRAFLAGYVRSCRTLTASELSGVSRQAHYDWLKRDPLYREIFERARMIVADAVEEEVWRRAYEGYETPIVYRGEITGHYKTYSDALAMFMLKSLRPEVYGDGAARPSDWPPYPRIGPQRAAAPSTEPIPSAVEGRGTGEPAGKPE